MQVVRLPVGPLITPHTHASIGTNINGPSLIRVPAWAPRRLGAYYLYFADHGGKYIRLAYADRLDGPWRVHAPDPPHVQPVLHLEQTICRGHIASPDVHVLHRRREIRMYFHGPVHGQPEQCSFVAHSPDGLTFTPGPQVLGAPYLRVFRYRSACFGVAMRWFPQTASTREQFFRSRDGVAPFEAGPMFIERGRHTAVLRRGDQLLVFFSRNGDDPERILLTRVDLRGDWRGWRAGGVEEVISPTEVYEGGDLPAGLSVMGAVQGRVRQLRDPAVFVERGRTYLLYSIAGESGIAIAEVRE